MQLRVTALFCLFLSLSHSQEPLKPVGIKITRPGVVSIAGTPPVGGTLVSYGYSLDEPATGAHVQGMSTLFEYTLATRVSMYVVTTEPLVRDGNFAWGDTCPGIKFRLAKETSRRPLLAISYGVKVPTATTGFGTGRYDHKINTHADKGIGRTRWTGNFATVWAEQKDGRYIRQHTLPSEPSPAGTDAGALPCRATGPLPGKATEARWPPPSCKLTPTSISSPESCET